MADDNSTSGDHDPDDDAGADNVGAQGLSEADQRLADELLTAVRTVEGTSDPAEEPLITPPTLPPPLPPPRHPYIPRMMVSGPLVPSFRRLTEHLANASENAPLYLPPAAEQLPGQDDDSDDGDIAPEPLTEGWETPPSGPVPNESTLFV